MSMSYSFHCARFGSPLFSSAQTEKSSNAYSNQTVGLRDIKDGRIFRN